MPDQDFCALLGDASFAALKQTLIERTGLFYYQDKELELAAAIAARMQALNIAHCAGYHALLNCEAGATEFLAIVARLTIGETYFFRHDEQFAALRDLVLPEILRRNRNRRNIRIWSAGCATGAEPYSLSILLRRDLAHLTAGWDIEIVGSDINREFLAAAETGIFNDWALRSVTDDIREQCFLPCGKRWELAPAYRTGVSFRQHNLASDVLPAADAADLILCRNVMIYFNQEFIPVLINRFHNWLVPGGWLVVGHAEANLHHFQRFLMHDAPGAALFQNPPSSLAPAEWLPMPLEQARWYPVEMPEPPLARALPTAPTWEAVEKRITQKDWPAASKLCDRLLALDPVDSRGHFLKALILEAGAQTAEQEKSLRRSIYLDRGFVAGHYHLALLLERMGDARALRSWETIERLLSRLAPDSRLIPLSSVEAGALTEITRQKLHGDKVA